MFRRLLLMLAVLLFGVMAGAQDDTLEDVRYWLETLHGYEALGIPLDESYTDELDPFPLASDGTIRIGLTGDELPEAVELSVFGDGAEVALLTQTIARDGDSLVWEPELGPGVYVLLAQPADAPDATFPVSWTVEVLGAVAVADHFAEPPPMLLHVADDAVRFGLIGGYCFPPVDGDPDTQENCLLYDAPPEPEEFFALPDNTIHAELLARPYPTRAAFYLSGRDQDNHSSNRVFYDLDPANAQTAFSWRPDLPPGDYVLTVLVDWGASADASYYFGVTFTE